MVLIYRERDFMKRILLVTALTLGVAQNAIASGSYNGWSAGTSLGWSGTTNKIGFDDPDDQKAYEQAGVKTSAKSNLAVFGLHADWHKTMPNCLYFGFGLGLGTHFGSSKSTLFDGKIATVQNTVKLTYKRGFYGDLTARLGISVNKAIVYGLLAIRGTNVKYQLDAVTPTTTTTWKTSKMDVGFGPGLGFDIKVSDKVSVGAEYRCLFEKGMKIPQVGNSADKTNFKKHISHNLGARVSYHF